MTDQQTGKAPPSYWHFHTMGDIVTGCVKAGLQIAELNEYPHSNREARLRHLSRQRGATAAVLHAGGNAIRFEDGQKTGPKARLKTLGLEGCAQAAALSSLVGVEAAIEGFALLGHFHEQLRCAELLAVLARQHLAHVDKGLCAHAVDVAQRPARVGREAEAEDGAEIGLARIGDDAFLHGAAASSAITAR
jgi:hypothetical protein